MERLDLIEEQLITLETRIAHQDRTIELLNTALVEQRAQVDDLIAKLREMSEQGNEPLIQDPSNDKPPHY